MVRYVNSCLLFAIINHNYLYLIELLTFGDVVLGEDTLLATNSYDGQARSLTTNGMLLFYTWTQQYYLLGVIYDEMGRAQRLRMCV